MANQDTADPGRFSVNACLRLAPLHQILTTYLQLTGIEGGYGFFAPNFSAGYQLVFELHYPNGRIENELPKVHSHAAGLRLATFLDRIGQEESDRMREIMIRLLVMQEYQRHPDADHIRAVFRSISPAGPRNTTSGKSSSKFQQIYDYRRTTDKAY